MTISVNVNNNTNKSTIGKKNTTINYQPDKTGLTTSTKRRQDRVIAFEGADLAGLCLTCGCNIF